MSSEGGAGKGGGAGRGPGRPSNAQRAAGLQTKIETSLKGLADLLERRETLEDADTFAAIIRRDAKLQAEWLAGIADNYATAEKLVLALFGAGSLLGFAGAFGPLVSRVVDRARFSSLLQWGFAEAEQPPEDDELGAGAPPGA